MKNTAAARQILRQVATAAYSDLVAVYTNKYQNCRTVKVYLRPSVNAHSFVKKAAALLAANPLTADATIKISQHSSYHVRRHLTSVIVRLPKTY